MTTVTMNVPVTNTVEKQKIRKNTHALNMAYVELNNQICMAEYNLQLAMCKKRQLEAELEQMKDDFFNNRPEQKSSQYDEVTVEYSVYVIYSIIRKAFPQIIMKQTQMCTTDIPPYRVYKWIVMAIVAAVGGKMVTAPGTKAIIVDTRDMASIFFCGEIEYCPHPFTIDEVDPAMVKSVRDMFTSDYGLTIVDVE